jgi:hypothetical protein
MIDAQVRIELAQDIRRLATGRMTNDEFDDRYYEVYESSADRAVSSIGGFCYGLYSSDLLFALRLRGRYALQRETKRTIARCVLFLRGSHEYGWPPFPEDSAGRWLFAPAYNLGFPGGIALTIIGLAMVTAEPEPFAFQLLAVGLPLTAFCFWFCFLRRRVPAVVWQQYTGAGDYDCWPFLQREQFEAARGGRQVAGG